MNDGLSHHTLHLPKKTEGNTPLHTTCHIDSNWFRIGTIGPASECSFRKLQVDKGLLLNFFQQREHGMLLCVVSASQSFGPTHAGNTGKKQQNTNYVFIFLNTELVACVGVLLKKVEKPSTLKWQRCLYVVNIPMAKQCIGVHVQQRQWWLKKGVMLNRMEGVVCNLIHSL